MFISIFYFTFVTLILKISFMMKNLEEIWRPIEGYPDYEISNLGRVRNKETGKYSKITVCAYDGYHRATCRFQSKGFQISRLVAKAFPDICGSWFDGCEVHHLDENPENKHADNLKVCTKEEHYAYHHDSRSEMMKKRSGINSPNFGKKFTEEHRRKIGDAHRGEKNPNYGKTPSEETRRKLSDANKRRYAAMTDEEKKKMTDRMRGENNPCYGKPRSEETKRKISIARSIPIYQYSLDNQFIKEWESCMAVKRGLGFDNGHIAECCKGKLKTSHGHKWKFKSDIENNQ